MNDIVIIENKIYEIRGQKVMLDFDLAEMYGIETRVLNQSVRRNIERFPSDFMFQLNNEEANSLKISLTSQIVISNKGGNRYAPFAFVHMRQYLLSHAPKQELEELRKRIEYLEEDVSSDRESYEKQFDELFSAFAKLSSAIQIKTTPLDRVKIEGFKNKK